MPGLSRDPEQSVAGKDHRVLPYGEIDHREIRLAEAGSSMGILKLGIGSRQGESANQSPNPPPLTAGCLTESYSRL